MSASELPGNVKPASDSTDAQLGLDADRLRAALSWALERQLAGLSHNLCEEIVYFSKGNFEKQPKKDSAHSSSSNADAHRSPGTPSFRLKRPGLLSFNTLDIPNYTSESPGSHSTTFQPNLSLSSQVVMQRSSTCGAELPVHEWTKRAYKNSNHYSSRLDKSMELTWIGTPKWQKHRPLLIPLASSTARASRGDKPRFSTQSRQSRQTVKDTPDSGSQLTSPTAATVSAALAGSAAAAVSKLRGVASELGPAVVHKKTTRKTMRVSMSENEVAAFGHDLTTDHSIIELRRLESDDSLPDELFDRPLASIVLKSQWFDILAGVMIFLSTVFIGFKTDYLVRNPTFFVGEFKVIDLIFCTFFVVELSMRLFVFRTIFFRVDGWEWNVLDLSLTIYQVIQEICEFILYLHRDGLSTFWQVHRPTPFAMYFRFLRFLRLFRLIRLSRLQGYITEFRVIATSVLKSVRYLIWACVILLVVIYIFAVHITLMVGRYAVVHPEQMAEGATLNKYWGSLPRSMFSLFQAITSGMDWYTLLEPLMDISIVSSGIFCLYICMTYLYVLNIITGVFVETATHEAQEIGEMNIVNKLREVFDIQDDDGSGHLTLHEFTSHLEDPRMRHTFHALDLDIEEAQNLFELLDMDGSGTVTYDEFVTGCLRLRGGAKSIDVATLLYECRKTKFIVQVVLENQLRFYAKLEDQCEATSVTDDDPTSSVDPTGSVPCLS